MNEELTKNLPGDRSEQILSLLHGIDGRLIGVEGQLIALDARLTGLEERVDRRLMETRPIWEQVLVRLDGIDARLDGIDARLDGLDQRIDNLGLDMRAGFKRIERQMAQLAVECVAVRADQSDLERRMDRLEDKLEAKPVG